MPNNPVFCKNCKHLKQKQYAHRCEHKSNLFIKRNYYEKYETFIRRPDRINKQNNCKNYEHKHISSDSESNCPCKAG